MKVKELKEALKLFNDEDEVIVQLAFKRNELLDFKEVDFDNFEVHDKKEK